MSVRQLVIPEGKAFFLHRQELDGANYLLDYKYNQRADCFYLELLDEVGEHLLGPIKIVSNYPLLGLRRYVNGLPPGDLFAIDTQQKITVPGMGVFGKGVGFYYFSASELAT